MDYLIADRFHVPPEPRQHYREKVLRMPDGYVCFDPPAEAPAVGPLPALERGHVTFGSFNNVAKLTPEVIALWAEIVRRVPGSRLLLVSPALDGATARERIGAAFVAAGGDRDRLELRGTTPWRDAAGRLQHDRPGPRSVPLLGGRDDLRGPLDGRARRDLPGRDLRQPALAQPPVERRADRDRGGGSRANTSSWPSDSPATCRTWPRSARGCATRWPARRSATARGSRAI